MTENGLIRGKFVVDPQIYIGRLNGQILGREGQCARTDSMW